VKRRGFALACCLSLSLTSCDGRVPVVESHGVTVMLFDVTDPPGASATASVLAYAGAALSGLARGDRLVVYVLDGHSRLPREVWSTDSPGRAAEANAWIEGPGYAEERFARQVALPLDSVLTALGSSSDTASVSDIEEAIATICRAENLGHGPGLRRLCLISDLLQNSAACSFYRAALPRELPFPPIDLTGVRVELLVLLRQNNGFQTGQLVALWSRYLERCGARVGERLLGAGK
jgi:hypothetical protein